MNEDRQRPNLASLRIDRTKRFDDRPRRGKWIWVTLGIAAIIALISYLVFGTSVAPALKVKTTTIAMISGSDAAADLVATGYVVAQRKAEVASKGTGRLEKLNFEEGDPVSTGQVIAVLDNKDIAANLDLARANFQRTEIDTLNSGRNYRRMQNLLKSGAITDAQIEDAEALYRSSLAALAASAAAVKTAEVNLENTYIRAPFSGTILTKNAEIGEIVAPFASSASSKGSVVTLADMKSLEVEADVSESNINKVSIGQPCEIVLDAYPTVRYKGSVKKIVPTADRARATVLTKVSFEQVDDRVLPEMSARVNFFGSTSSSAPQQMLAVAKDALTTRDDQRVLFAVDGEFVTQLAVKTGRELGTMVEILSGIEAGRKVVLSPPGKMATGQKVELAQ